MDALVVATLPQWQRHERDEYRPTAAEVSMAWHIPLNMLYFIIRVAQGKGIPYLFHQNLISDVTTTYSEERARARSITAKDYLEMIKTVPKSTLGQLSLGFLIDLPHDSTPLLARYASYSEPPHIDVNMDALGLINYLVELGEYMDVEFATYTSMGPISVDSIMKDLAHDDLSEMASRVITAELSNSIFVLHHAARGVGLMIKAYRKSEIRHPLILIELLQDAYAHSFPQSYRLSLPEEVMGLLWERYSAFDERTFNRTMGLMKRLITLDDSVVLEIVAYMTSPTMYKVLFLPNLDSIVDRWRTVYGLQLPLLRLVYLARTSVTSIAHISSRYTKIRRMETEESDLSKLINAMRRAQLIGFPGVRVDTQLATLRKISPYVIVEHILVHYELIPSKERPFAVFGRFNRDLTRSVWATFRSIHLTGDAGGGYFLSTKQLYSLRGWAKPMRRIFEDPLPMLTHLVITNEKFRYINTILENYIRVNKKGALKYLWIHNTKVTSAPPRSWEAFITLTNIERLKLSGPGGMGLVYHIPEGSFPEFLHLSESPTTILPTTDKIELHIQQLGLARAQQRKQKIYLTTDVDIEQPLEDIVQLIHTTTLDVSPRVIFPKLKTLRIANLETGDGGVLIAPELTKLSCTFRTWAMDVLVVPKLRHLSIFFPRAIRVTRETLKYPPTLTSLTVRGVIKPKILRLNIALPELTRFNWRRHLPIGGDVTLYPPAISLYWHTPKLQKLVLLAPKYRRRATTTIPYYRIRLMRRTPLLKMIALRGLNEFICEHPLPVLMDIYCINGSKLTFPTKFVSTKLRTVVQIHAAIEVPKRSERRYAIALECTNDMTCSDTAYPSPPHAVKATPAMVDKLDKIVIRM